MTTKYRPSNGTEGSGFIERFCGACERDRAFREDRGDSCPIVSMAMALETTDPDYPAEWTYDADVKPTCTAFVPEGGRVPTLAELEAAGQLNILDGAL